VLLFHLLQNITGLGTKPVMAIVQKSSTGAGTNVGLATGMISTFPTVLLFAAAILLAGFYGVALAASAMMAATAISDRCFGPYLIMQVVIAEMSELPKCTR
jgi:K(+)-stimulated pyrophosphate-energized sodium pump